MKLKDIFIVTSGPVVIASLCCLSPVILVVFGVGTVGFASSLADTLYGGYKWYFRAAGLCVMALSLVLYFRRTHAICTLDQARRRRQEIINMTAIAVTVGVAGYFFFLYVIVHYIGVFLQLWK